MIESGNSPGSLQELILGALGEGVYGLDKQGNGTFVNEAAVRILGWTGKDIIGAPLHDIHHHSHPDGSPYPREECPVYATMRSSGMPTGMRFRCNTPARR